MRPHETLERLVSFKRRGAGSDAERRAAVWLVQELRSSGRDVRLEPFWCRPNWAFAHAWHVGLALAGSLLSVHSPRVGAGLLAAALAAILMDAFTGVSPGRRLTPERASQNVVVSAADPPSADAVRLIVTANYDAGRMGLAYRGAVRAVPTRMRESVHAWTPGWLGWLVIAIAWLLAIAIVRANGHHGTALGVLQLAPTIVLVLTMALLLDIASADFAPAAGDNGTGTAVAIALVRALDAAPPGHVAVELVLQGAGDGGGLGLRHHLRARRAQLRAANAVVLGIAACGAGAPRYWRSDGTLMPLAYLARLRQLCASIAETEADLNIAEHRARGAGPALPARARGLPAITIGCVEASGAVPRSHQRTDTLDRVDQRPMDLALEFGLILVDGIDATVADMRGDAANNRPLTPA